MPSINLLDVFSHAMFIVMMTVGLIALPALVVGLAISIFQATTQINDFTLGFLPKFIVVILTVMFLGPWLFHLLVSYAQTVFGQLLLLNG